MIECRGRNGWFDFRKANVEVFKTSDRVAISMQSKSCYRNVAPIYFAGPRAEIDALLADLLEKVRSS